MDFQGFCENVSRWGDKTFPHSTPDSIMAHFKREVRELEMAYRDGVPDEDRATSTEVRDNVGDEIADCILLLIHMAHKYGVDLPDTLVSVHLRNIQATWGSPDGQGVSERASG